MDVMGPNIFPISLEEKNKESEYLLTILKPDLSTQYLLFCFVDVVIAQCMMSIQRNWKTEWKVSSLVKLVNICTW